MQNMQSVLKQMLSLQNYNQSVITYKKVAAATFFVFMTIKVTTFGNYEQTGTFYKYSPFW